MKMRNLLALALLIALPMGVVAQDFEFKKSEKVDLPSWKSEFNNSAVVNKAPAADDNQYIIKYSNDDLYGLGGINQDLKVRLAIKVKPEDAAALQGTKLTAIGYALTTSQDYPTPGYSDFSVFVSTVPEGDNDVVKQSCGSSDITAGWHEVTLDEPYTITGESFYLGYEGTLAAGHYGIGISAETGDAWTNVMFYAYYQNEWIDMVWDESYGGLQVYGIAEGQGTVTKVNLSIESVSGPSMVKSGESSPVSIAIKNNGIELLESINVSYEFNGQTVESEVTGQFFPATTSSATFDVDFVAEQEVEYQTLNFTVSDVNGREDETPSDNVASLGVNVYKEEAQFDTPRSILMEQFTTELCGYCPQGEELIEAVLPNYDEPIVRVAHHAGYYYDNYTLDYSEQMAYFFYNDMYSYAPAVMFARKHYADFPGASSEFCPGPVFSVDRTLLTNALNDQITIPNLVTVNLETEYDQANQVVKIRVYGQNKLVIENPVINVFITEDNITAERQAGATGTWIHNHVLREVLTGLAGAALEFGEDGSYEYETEWVVKSSITGSYGTTSVNLDNVNVVAFVGNMDTSNPNNCEVYNCAEKKNVIASGISTGSEVEGINVYAVGDCVVIEGEFDNASVYTVDGVLARTLQSGEGMTEVRGLNQGIYLVKVEKGGDSQVTKVALR